MIFLSAIFFVGFVGQLVGWLVGQINLLYIQIKVNHSHTHTHHGFIVEKKGQNNKQNTVFFQSCWLGQFNNIIIKELNSSFLFFFNHLTVIGFILATLILEKKISLLLLKVFHCVTGSLWIDEKNKQKKKKNLFQCLS